MLDTFIKELAKQPYFVYSEEFKLFYTMTGDQLKKALKSISQVDPHQILAKY
jgi:hypothetical protein